MSGQHNPWKVLSETEAYDNPWIRLTEYAVINPGGGKGIYGKVHFKNIAVGIVALDDELNIYLVGQFRFPVDRYSWEIPEGGSDRSGDPLEGAKKELSEETGLIAHSWAPLMEMQLSNSVTDEHCIVFIARQLEQHHSAPEETEQLVVKKIPFEAAYRMVGEGTIIDAISVAAILKVKLMIVDGRIA